MIAWLCCVVTCVCLLCFVLLDLLYFGLSKMCLNCEFAVWGVLFGKKIQKCTVGFDPTLPNIEALLWLALGTV